MTDTSMNDANESAIKIIGIQDHDMTYPVPIDLKKMWERALERRDGNHLWSVHVVYFVDDPEMALNNMTLDESNFIGVTDLHCLFCHSIYDTAIRSDQCAGVAP